MQQVGFDYLDRAVDEISVGRSMFSRPLAYTYKNAFVVRDNGAVAFVDYGAYNWPSRSSRLWFA